MSEREFRRVEVLNEVQSGRRTVAAEASLLDISERQAYRLLSRYQENGEFGLVHKTRGRISNRSHYPAVRKLAVELVKTHYEDSHRRWLRSLAERHAKVRRLMFAVT